MYPPTSITHRVHKLNNWKFFVIQKNLIIASHLLIVKYLTKNSNKLENYCYILIVLTFLCVLRLLNCFLCNLRNSPWANWAPNTLQFRMKTKSNIRPCHLLCEVISLTIHQAYRAKNFWVKLKDSMMRIERVDGWKGSRTIILEFQFVI